MNNPFNPPSAKLEREVPEPPSPPAIRLATRLLWGTMLLSLINLFPGVRTDYWESLEDAPLELVTAIFVLVFVLFSTLVIYIGKRVNWARWVMFVFLGYGWIDTATNLSSLLAQGQLAIAVEIVVVAGEIYAIWLLFFSEGAQWFKASQP